MKRCTKCILPETFPGITFDEEGICNYCHQYEEIKVKGREALEREMANFRDSKGKYDCMATISGGRDSTYVLHQLVKAHNMRVLACSFDCGLQSELGKRNTKKACEKLGVDLVTYPYKIKRNIEEIRRNFMAWSKRPSPAMIPIFMVADKTMEYHMRKVARQKGIKLIVSGESTIEHTFFKSGFLGVPAAGHGYDITITSKLKLLVGYIREYARNPRYLSLAGLYESIIGFFAYFYGHKFFRHIRLINYFDYIMWNEKQIVSTNIKELDWELLDDTILTWRNDDAMPPLYNYLYYRMVGFTENDALRSNMIRNGMMSREEALKTANLENKPRMKALQDLFRERLKLPLELLDDVPKYKG